jgi:hypothetical protein
VTLAFSWLFVCITDTPFHWAPGGHQLGGQQGAQHGAGASSHVSHNLSHDQQYTTSSRREHHAAVAHRSFFAILSSGRFTAYLDLSLTDNSSRVAHRGD